MLKMGKISLLIILISTTFISNASWGLTPEQILEKMNKAATYTTARMEATMRIVNKKGQETPMKLISFEKKEGDKSLIRYTYPPRLKSTAILVVEDNIWYYNRRTNRVRLLSRAAKKGSMMGSSFSYDDLSIDYQKDFTATIIKETSDQYELNLKPKDKEKKYKYLKVVVAKSNFIASKIEYYNQGDQKFKEMIATDIKNIKGHIAPLKITMTEISSQKVTYMEIDESKVEYNIPLENKIFSHQHLKK